MSDQSQVPGWDQLSTTPQPVQPPKPKRRVFMWVILAINVLFLVWLITGTGSAASNIQDCTTLASDAQDLCNAGNTGTAIGTGIGMFLIIALWAFVDVILGVVYLVTRKR